MHDYRIFETDQFRKDLRSIARAGHERIAHRLRAGAAARRGAVHPTLSEAANIFVMVDEAHRTQYRSLAANMRQALPNACFLGFTGTPIDKKDRSTLRTFGPYIDTYTIEQAVRDKATVPIFYESRLPELQIVGQTLDQVFDRVFAVRTEDERALIRQRFATEQAVAGAPRRIEAVCLDLIDHFTRFIAPNRFKAQVVAASRHTAVTFKETLDRLNGPESALIMSAGHNDEARLARWRLRKDEQDQAIERFKNRGDRLSVLVVCDMLLTGFDAPVEQVLYLDAPLKEHTLLQAIARVNRPLGEEKTYGLVVDYWGVSAKLQDALAVFSTTDVQGALTPNVDELPRLESRHAAAMKFFGTVADTNDLDACVRVLEPEDVRAGFDLAFRRFGQSMDMLLPDPRALAYHADLRWLGKIRGTARARYLTTGSTSRGAARRCARSSPTPSPPTASRSSSRRSSSSRPSSTRRSTRSGPTRPRRARWSTPSATRSACTPRRTRPSTSRCASGWRRSSPSGGRNDWTRLSSSSC